jgi:hypothetical protein
MSAHWETPLGIYSVCVSNKEIYWIFKSCCMISVLFSINCHLFNNFVFFSSRNIYVFNKPCAKIWILLQGG